MGMYTDRGYDLATAKGACAGEIETWYGGKTLDVFDTNATGVMRRYFCAESDQLRMVNGRVSNTSIELMCGVVPAETDQDPEYSWLTHSAAESGKVHTDYVQFVKTITTKYQDLKLQLEAATTVAAVDLVLAQLV